MQLLRFRSPDARDGRAHWTHRLFVLMSCWIDVLLAQPLRHAIYFGVDARQVADALLNVGRDGLPRIFWWRRIVSGQGDIREVKFLLKPPKVFVEMLSETHEL